MLGAWSPVNHTSLRSCCEAMILLTNGQLSQPQTQAWSQMSLRTPACQEPSTRPQAMDCRRGDKEAPGDNLRLWNCIRPTSPQCLLAQGPFSPMRTRTRFMLLVTTSLMPRTVSQRWQSTEQINVWPSKEERTAINVGWELSVPAYPQPSARKGQWATPSLDL